MLYWQLLAQAHNATLLPDGTVRLFGGTDVFGRPIQVDEVFDPVINRFRSAAPDGASIENQGRPQVAASIPQGGASGVDVQDILAVRLTVPLKRGPIPRGMQLLNLL